MAATIIKGPWVAEKKHLDLDNPKPPPKQIEDGRFKLPNYKKPNATMPIPLACRSTYGMHRLADRYDYALMRYIEEQAKAKTLYGWLKDQVINVGLLLFGHDPHAWSPA